MLQYSKLHQMVLMILLIGWINIYDTFKNITISSYLNINDKNLLILIFITCLFMLIYFYNSLELEIILAISFIALSILLLSNDMIIFFLTLELYSLSVYLLVYNKPLLTLIYFIIGSISSSFILLSLALFYLYSGSFNLSFILEYFNTFYNYHTDSGLLIALSLFILALLFKLGSAPFQYWVIRVYSNMNYNILIYQSIIPKIVYILILLSIFSYNLSEFIFILIFASFLSLIIGAIGPLTYSVKHYKTIMAYSSIYNLGFLLMGVATGGNIIQYLFIYSLNTYHLLIALLIPANNYYYLLSLIISLFSFIGFPPMAGFYAKLNIFINCINSNHPIFLLGVAVMLITTLIASFFYLKFIKTIYFQKKLEIKPKESYSNIIYSFITLLLTFYPFFLSFFSPFFDSFSW